MLNLIEFDLMEYFFQISKYHKYGKKKRKKNKNKCPIRYILFYIKILK